MSRHLRSAFVACIGAFFLTACGANDPTTGQTGGAGGSGGDAGGSGGSGGVEPVCGDGQLQAPETCDDGDANSDTAADACRTDCTPARCGDGVRDTGEACDDGNTVPDDGCSPTCASEACGNGALDGDEECDDGNTAAGDGCSPSCTDEGTPACGDGILQRGETCDDGNEDPTDECVACEPAACGDGQVWADHEECDDGNATSGDGCSATCIEESACGDGLLDDGEECDDGNTEDLDACRNDCTAARCGDGAIWAEVEACDDGANNSNTRADACRTDCTLPRCGDAVIDTGEECEDGNTSTTDGCIACRVAVCGDGYVRAVVEECDHGAQNSDTDPNACRTNCRPARCGDTVVDAGESCDDGNTVPTDGCNNCQTPPVCGNGRREAGEACDDGNVAAGDGCSTRCVLETNVCGAAIVDLNSQAVPTPSGFTYQGTTVGGGNDSEGSCQALDGADVVLAYSISRRADLVLTTDASGGVRDTVIYARRNCAAPATELGCDDDSGTGAAASLVIRDLAANTQVYIAVDDGAGQSAPDAFTLTGRIVPIGGAGEPCDPQGALSRCDGALFCSAVTNVCTAAVCGDGTRDPTEECDDGNTANLDGCSARCRLEGETCGEPLVLTAAGGTVTFSGDTTGARADYAAGCSPSGGNRDIVYAFASPTAARWTFHATASFNTVLYARATCEQASTELACADNSSAPGGDDLAVDLLAGETAFLFVDGYGTGTVVNQGTYSVTGTALPLKLAGQPCDPAGVTDTCQATAYCSATSTCVPHACGDGVVWTGHEECDDENTASADGCSAACVREGDVCTAPSVATWSAAEARVVFGGDTRSATPNYLAGCATSAQSRDHVWSFTAPFRARYTFTATAAFDTVLAAQTTCGSSSSNLACSNSAAGPGGDVLVVELAQNQAVTLLVDGFDGVGTPAEGTYAVVGTALPIRVAGEACDTGGVADLCDVGTYCHATTAVCTAHVCGDGVLRAPQEECDDGNVTPFDGCSATCRREGDVCAAPSLASWNNTDNRVVFGGDTTGLASNYAAGCANTDTQPDAVWRFVAPFKAKYTFTVAPATFNSVLAVQGACGDNATNLGCSNSSTGNAGGDTLTVQLDANQTVSILVDGFNLAAGNKGTYTVTGTALPIRAVGLACDPVGVADLCDVGSYCHPTTALCTAHVCGDGRLYGAEQCDDGNTTPYDGCSGSCAFEVTAEAEPNNDAATATPTYRTSRNLGTISAAGDVDVYRLNLTGGGVVFDVWAQTSDGSGTTTGCPFDTTLELLASDGTTVLATDTDDGPGTCSLIDPAVDGGASRLAAGVYFLRVKHSSSTGSSANPYDLDVRTTTRFVRSTGQACDPTAQADVCVATARCDAVARTCIAHACGDGYLWAGIETCDDANVVPQDGCSATCTLEGDTCAAVPSLNVTDRTVDPNVWTWEGNTSTFARDFDGAQVTTGGSCPNTSGKRDAVASFTVPADGSYRAEITTPAYWDTVLFATTTCGGTQGLGCADAANFELHGLVAGQTVFLVVDGYGSTVSDSSSGPFTLKVTRRVCGDGVLTTQLGEQCDDGNTVNTDACVACRTARCGDGAVRTGTEGCDDGNNVGGDGCSSHCVIEGGCGDFIVQAGETCDDGGTTANDGCSATCQTETGWTCAPNVSCLPICGDGLLKGDEACDDSNANAWDGCTSCRFDGDSCASAIPLAMLDTNADPAIWSYAGNTSTFRADAGVSAPCKTSEAGKDAIYAFTAPAAATYAFSVTATWNAVLFAYDGTCGGTVVACSGAAAAGAAESFEVPMTAGQTIYLVVDAETSSASGAFTLRADRRYCGDGIVSAPEVCDAGAANSNTAPNACRLDCRPAHCGDAVVDTGERCDDGNTTDGDGCSASCIAAGLCGNGVVDAGEGCDDGDASVGDGCSLACTAETGWNCAGNNCLPICGDGLLVGPEGCDDGNTVDGDGCDANCQCASPVPHTFAASIPTPIPIPDGPAGGTGTNRTWRTATISVTGVSGSIIDLDVGVNITHEFNADLEIQLVAPNGTTLWLADDSFSLGENAYAGTVFDDDANPTAFVARVSSQTATASTVQTPLQPQQALALLDGTSPNGTWTLKVADDYSGDLGTLYAFSLAFRTLGSIQTGTAQTFASSTAVPIPDSASTPALSTITVPTSAWSDAYDVAVHVNLTHASVGQLELVLIAPGNERYLLSDNRGGTCANFLTGAEFTEGGTAPVNLVATSPCPSGVTAAPESSLGKLVGIPMTGVWTLEVKDTTTGTVGTLNSWSLEFVPASCDLPR